jgi:transglutaminase-like putative cysteine protease
VQATLAYHFANPAEVLLLLEAAQTPNQIVRAEELVITPATSVTRFDDPASGERRLVFTAAGEVEINYSAKVEMRGMDHALAGLPASAVSALPAEALSYLLPSRYCPSDRLQAFVDGHFASGAGGDKVLAMIDWLRTNIAYRPGASDTQTTALDTFVDRAGVCRDFSHLAICFCRAAGIPARVVSAYAWRLDPPDMHAIVEVFLGGRWLLIDPTGRAPPEGLVRVAAGRDVGDVAFMTIFGETELRAQTFAVTELPS